MRAITIVAIIVLLPACAARHPWGDYDKLDQLSDKSAIVVAGLTGNANGLIDFYPDSASERSSRISAARFVEGGSADRIYVTSTESGRVKWRGVRMKGGFWNIRDIGTEWVQVEPGKINYIGTVNLKVSDVDGGYKACFTIEDRYDDVVSNMKKNLPEIAKGREIVKRIMKINFKCK
jgi:hypothetical protein